LKKPAIKANWFRSPDAVERPSAELLKAPEASVRLSGDPFISGEGLPLAISGLMTGPAKAAGMPGTSQSHDPGSVPAGPGKSDWNGIRAADEAGRHESRTTENGHEAQNPGLGWRTTWDGRGFPARPASAGDGA